ncbi:MAG: dienelactone hydrolase family protein [Ignavibacteriales bacterium]|nr:dienelactone hydrolase family protein [Ignavibacteriales bacterium]
MKTKKIKLDSLCSTNIFTSLAGQELPWRGYESVNKSAGLLPVFIFLHGSGERGTDNRKQLTFMDILFPVIDSLEAYPALYIFPQCPEEKRWVECDWDAETHIMPETPSDALQALYELINEKLSTKKYDPARIYIVGLSMGGFGVWDMMARTPDLIAAAVPICGGADENTGKIIKDIPVHAFHGALDKAVSVSRTRNIIEAMRKAGGNPLYTEYPEEGHGSWNPAFREKGLLQWIFAQKKK